MTLNWRLGLFRLWLVGAILFALAVSAVGYSSVRDAFTRPDFIPKYSDNKEEIAIPQACSAARGIKGPDYRVGRIPGSIESIEKDRNCWYRMADFRRLYPEFSNIPDEELANKQYWELGAYPDYQTPWGVVGRLLAVILGPSLAVLALGAALVWAVSGFSARKPT
ncbi:MAG TPA: hypothetical protein VK602_00665 [Phyllobacterium sp.]|nr:hypothetical protein [Phyllobacterium sp.]